MSQSQSRAMPHEQFLLVAGNLLQKALVEVGRTQAKQVYRRLEGGDVVPLSRVRFEDKSLMSFFVSLDCSEFRGTLNYGAYRASLTALLANIGAAIDAKKEFRVFSEKAGGRSIIFGITALTVEQGAPNVMVLSAGPAAEPEATELRLMYLDPNQFSQSADEALA